MVRSPWFSPLAITFTRGQGVWLYDDEKNAYLDGLSGFGFCNLGYKHPILTKTIQEQAEKLIHTPSLFSNLEQETLAKKLMTLTQMGDVFFSNSGAEANEIAIKLARLYGHKKGIETPSIIVMEGAFHGHTMGTLTASGSRSVQAGFEPLLPGFIRAPFNDLDALKRIGHHRNDIVAVMLEPIQSQAVLLAEDSYLSFVSNLCKEKNWLLILDEVYTGVGRTGKFLASHYTEAKPDIITIANGLANGMPIGACLVRDKVNNHLYPGASFGGNALVSAVASKLLWIIEADQLIENAYAMGAYLKEGLISDLSHLKGVSFICGRGLDIGIGLDRSLTKELLELGIEHKVLFSITAENIIKVMPPLIINKEETQELLKRLCKSIKDFLK